MFDAEPIFTRLVPEPKRGAVHAIAEDCRQLRRALLAHAGASGGCCSDGERLVEQVRDHIESVYARQPLAEPWPMDDALIRYEIPKSILLGYVDACAREARTVRYATWASLRHHCEEVGGSVAAMIGCALGLTHSDVRQHAIALGAAARLVAIVRELRGDLDRKTIYVPLEDLAASRCSERELLSSQRASEATRNVVPVQVERARALLDDAAAGVAWVAGDSSRLAVSLFIEWHRAVLDEIERGGFDVFGDPPLPSPSLVRVLRRLPRAWRLAHQRPDASGAAGRPGASRNLNRGPAAAR